MAFLVQEIPGYKNPFLPVAPVQTVPSAWPVTKSDSLARKPASSLSPPNTLLLLLGPTKVPFFQSPIANSALSP